MTTPYLIRFALKRNIGNDSLEDVYDDTRMVSMVPTETGKTPVVTLPNFANQKTKKQDIEKGDDMKDHPSPPPPKPRPK